MATISTDTFLDGGTARTAGESWSINGCTLTIRTDSRVHANAPASMTGTHGSIQIQISTGGAVRIDGTKIRWMPYSSGSGTVPAIGTMITQGGVSGYLLGVWPDYQSAPQSPGGTMPATGFIKFREVTGGTFSAGALTGISASASSADVVGWMEVVMDANAAITTTDIGRLTVTGDWFYLDNTSGSRGQQIKVPTNGGGANTHVQGVQIETAPGSGVYEWFPSNGVSVGGALFAPANFSTDARSKFVESMGNGVVRIGNNGTNDVGYLPPAGCKVRIPNVFGRSAATASRAANLVPGSTPGSITGSNYDIDGFHCDLAFTASNVVFLSLKRFMFHTNVSITNNREAIVMNDCLLGGFNNGSPTATTLKFDLITNGAVENVKVVNAATVLGTVNMTASKNLVFTNLESISAKTRTAGTSTLSVSGGCDNIQFNGLKVKGAGITFASSTNLVLKNMDYVDRTEGATTTANPMYGITMQGCTGVLIDGFTIGENGALSNAQSYSALVVTNNTPSTNVKVRNFGTRANPLNTGTGTTATDSMFSISNAGDSNISYQRMYATFLRSNLFSGPSTAATGILVEDIYAANFPSSPSPLGRAAVFRKIGATYPSIMPTTNSGTHWVDYYTSETTGAIRWYGEPPTAETAARNYLTVTPSLGTGYLGSLAALSLDTAGDASFSETEWLIKGHTGFQNASLVYNTSGSLPTSTNSIQPSNMTVGGTYTILTAGSTNFTLYGAPNNNVGTMFVATAVGTGNGTISRFQVGQTYTIRTVGTSDYTLMGAPNNNVGTVFVATAVTTAGSGTLSPINVHFQVDNGSGYGGTWLPASPDVLGSTTLNPAGARFKIRISVSMDLATMSGSPMALQSLAFLTTTTATDQAANQYPLDVVTLSFEGLKPGSEVRAYVGTNPATAVEIGGTESSGTTFSFTHSSSGQEGYIAIFALGYQPIQIPRTYAFSDSSLLIQQVIDRNYVNP